MNELFDFEKDFVNTMRCIPMAVRLKLDLCGIKLNLKEWLALLEGERKALLEAPCRTEEETRDFRLRLNQLVLGRTGKAPQILPIPAEFAWDQSGQIPQDVRAKAESEGVKVTPDQWALLERLKRFTLCKLSRPGHENKNFLPAAKEFGFI